MAYEFVTVERDGPLTLVTMNRPQVFNALHKPAHLEMEKVFDAFEADPDQWVCVLTGAGDKAFSAGNDLKYTAAGGERGWGRSGFGGITQRFDSTKPIIAAVNGFAMGGGFEIALSCDLIVAAENATFALPEPSVGLAAMAGGLLRLPRVIGEKRAMGMILTGRRVGPQEGKELGFVNEIAPTGKAVEVAKALALKICELSPMSIRASKQTVVKSLQTPSVEQAFKEQESYSAVQAMFKSADLIEGPKAFAEKRKPVWKGR